MKKHFYLLFLLIIIAGGVFENQYTNNFFNEFETRLSEIITVQESLLEKEQLTSTCAGERIFVNKTLYNYQNAFSTDNVLKIELADEDINEEGLSDYEKSLNKLKQLFQWWKKGKASLHTFIPHNELREIEGLFAESICYIEINKADFAMPKLKKLREFTINIPHTFAILLENIF